MVVIDVGGVCGDVCGGGNGGYGDDGGDCPYSGFISTRKLNLA